MTPQLHDRAAVKNDGLSELTSKEIKEAVKIFLHSCSFQTFPTPAELLVVCSNYWCVTPRRVEIHDTKRTQNCIQKPVNALYWWNGSLLSGMLC